jgi:hypothetical protein
MALDQEGVNEITEALGKVAHGEDTSDGDTVDADEGDDE